MQTLVMRKERTEMDGKRKWRRRRRLKVERMENQRPKEDMDRRISNNLQWQHNNDIVVGKEWE